MQKITPNFTHHFHNVDALFSLRLGEKDNLIQDMSLKEDEYYKQNNAFLLRWLRLVVGPSYGVVVASQIHSNRVMQVINPGFYHNTDGFISSKKKLLLTIFVADCAAVLIYEKSIPLIAAIHVGWRGARLSILHRATQKMICLGAKINDSYVFVGPCLSKKNFEIKKDVAVYFPSKYLSLTTKNTWIFDFKAYLYTQLLECGFMSEKIQIYPWCTYEQEKQCFSYRRQGEKSGRMVGCIWLT